jgi:aspartate racemase
MSERIGIIGGNGVAATNKLCDLIEIELTKNGAFRDFHHPELIIYQATQSPSRSMFIEGRGKSFIEDYVNIAKKLHSIGADTICMCCNTAHYAIEIIQSESGVQFINLIDEVVKTAYKKFTPSPVLHKIGVMATDGCIFGKVYERYFKKYFDDNALVIYPEPDMQKEVTRGICNIKNNSRFFPLDHPDRPFSIFSRVYDHLLKKGAQLRNYR